MLLLSLTIILVSTSVANANSIRVSENLKQMSVKDMQRSIDNRCLDCICQKESSCNRNQGCGPNPPPNGDIACGAFQIRKPYFQDCCVMLNMGNCDSDSAWQNCAKDYSCALRCVTAYVQTYGNSCSQRAFPSCDIYSRVHNGGPQGCNNSTTLSYWQDVQRCYGDHNPYQFACTVNSDCTNSLHVCFNSTYAYSGTDPNGWFCNGLRAGADCSSNADCLSNICEGTCKEPGGAGTVCMNSPTNDAWGCTSSCQCIPFENFGYCQC